MTDTLTALHAIGPATLDTLAVATGTDPRAVAADLYTLARRGLVHAARAGDAILYTARGAHGHAASHA